MRINEIIAMILTLAAAMSYFYNPNNFTNFQIIVLILLSLINWNTTKLFGIGEVTE